jgi:hypothetical protein
MLVLSIALMGNFLRLKTKNDLCDGKDWQAKSKRYY